MGKVTKTVTKTMTKKSGTAKGTLVKKPTIMKKGGKKGC